MKYEEFLEKVKDTSDEWHEIMDPADACACVMTMLLLTSIFLWGYFGEGRELWQRGLSKDL